MFLPASFQANFSSVYIRGVNVAVVNRDHGANLSGDMVPVESKEGAPDATFAKVLQLVRTVQVSMQNIESEHGLSGSQLWALWQISARPGLRVSDLASVMQVRHSTASNLLDKLEQRALIKRERQTDDTRVVRIYLTQDGQAVMGVLPGPLHGRLRQALQDLPENELLALHHGLSCLIDTLSVSQPEKAEKTCNY